MVIINSTKVGAMQHLVALATALSYYILNFLQYAANHCSSVGAATTWSTATAAARRDAAGRKQPRKERKLNLAHCQLLARAQVFLFLSLPSYLSCNVNYFSSTAFNLLIFPFLPASSDGTIAPSFRSQWAKRLGRLQQRWYQFK